MCGFTTAPAYNNKESTLKFVMLNQSFIRAQGRRF